MSVPMTSYLRKALIADAAVSGAAALGMMAGSAFLPAMLNLPSGLLFWAGALLAPFVAGLVAMARRPHAASSAIMAVIAINIAWVAASLFVAFGAAFEPNLFGKVFILAQAGIVLLFADLQIVGMRRAGRSPA